MIRRKWCNGAESWGLKYNSRRPRNHYHDTRTSPMWCVNIKWNGLTNIPAVQISEHHTHLVCHFHDETSYPTKLSGIHGIWKSVSLFTRLTVSSVNSNNRYIRSCRSTGLHDWRWSVDCPSSQSRIRLHIYRVANERGQCSYRPTIPINKLPTKRVFINPTESVIPSLYIPTSHDRPN